MVDVQKLREARAADVRRREQERRIRVGLDKPPQTSSGGSGGGSKFPVEIRDQTGRVVARSTSMEEANRFIAAEKARGQSRSSVQYYDTGSRLVRSDSPEGERLALEFALSNKESTPEGIRYYAIPEQRKVLVDSEGKVIRKTGEDVLKTVSKRNELPYTRQDPETMTGYEKYRVKKEEAQLRNNPYARLRVGEPVIQTYKPKSYAVGTMPGREAFREAPRGGGFIQGVVGGYRAQTQGRQLNPLLDFSNSPGSGQTNDLSGGQLAGVLIGTVGGIATFTESGPAARVVSRTVPGLQAITAVRTVPGAISRYAVGPVAGYAAGYAAAPRFLDQRNQRLAEYSPAVRQADVVAEMSRITQQSNMPWYKKENLVSQIPILGRSQTRAGEEAAIREYFKNDNLKDAQLNTIIRAARQQGTRRDIGLLTGYVVGAEAAGEALGTKLATKSLAKPVTGKYVRTKLFGRGFSALAVPGFLEGSSQDLLQSYTNPGDLRIGVDKASGALSSGVLGTLTAGTIGGGVIALRVPTKAIRPFAKKSIAPKFGIALQGLGYVADFPGEIGGDVTEAAIRRAVTRATGLPIEPPTVRIRRPKTPTINVGGGKTISLSSDQNRWPTSTYAQALADETRRSVKVGSKTYTPVGSISVASDSNTNIFDQVFNQASSVQSSSVPVAANTNIFSSSNVPSSVNDAVNAVNSNTFINTETDTFTETTTTVPVITPSRLQFAGLPLPPLLGGDGSGSGGVAVRKRPRFVNELAASIALLGKLTSPRAQYVRPSTGTNSRKRKDSTKKRQKKVKKKKRKATDTPNVSLRPASSSSARRVLRGLFR